jgi:hypothetical protein
MIPTAPLTQNHFNFAKFFSQMAALALLADTAYNVQDRAGTPSVLLDPAIFGAMLSAGMNIITAHAQGIVPPDAPAQP